MTASPILVIGELCPDIVVAGVPTDGRALRFGQSEDLVAGTVMTLGSSWRSSTKFSRAAARTCWGAPKRDSGTAASAAP